MKLLNAYMCNYLVTVDNVCIYPTLPHKQDVKQGQTFKQSLTGMNSEFSFS